MNEGKPSEVLIEREGKTWRWGQNEYFKTWNGLKQTFNIAALKIIALPLAIVIGIVTFFFSGKKELNDSRGSPVQVPTLSAADHVLQAPILSSQNTTNAIPKLRVGVGVVGRIKVFNLRDLSEIPVGSEARAILVSGASNGIVKAKLISSLLVDGDPVLPVGTTLFGKGLSQDERLFVEFKKAIFPTGESFSIRAQAFDVADKILGLKGAFVGTRTKKMGIAIGFGFLSGMAEGLQETSGSNFWGQTQKKSTRDAALSGASKATLDQSQAYLDEMKNSPHIIEVKKGTEFYLIIDEPKPKEESEFGK